MRTESSTGSAPTPSKCGLQGGGRRGAAGLLQVRFGSHSSPALPRTAYEWVNPAAYGLVVVTSSEGRNLPYGRLEDILSRDSSALNCHTNDDKNAWFAVDLGLWVLPSAYTLRHAR